MGDVNDLSTSDKITSEKIKSSEPVDTTLSSDKISSTEAAATPKGLNDDQLRQIAEMVYRLMLNDLKVERERLGRP